MEWSLLNWINVFFLFTNGYLAISFLESDDMFPGYLNLLASATNAACIASILL